MINFRLFGYPIQIQWMFWLICGVLGMNLLRVPGQEGIIKMLIWVGTILVSIIWHELGHAFARKKYRAPYSEIVLHGFGGYCSGPGNFTRKESMIISFAGPLANFMLGAALWAIAISAGGKFDPNASWLLNIQGTDPWLAFFIGIALMINLGWALINLLPVYPLDGGQIFSAYMANRNPSIVPKVGTVVAAAAAVYGLLDMGSIWMAFLFGMLAYQNWQRSQGGRPTRFF